MVFDNFITSSHHTSSQISSLMSEAESSLHSEISEIADYPSGQFSVDSRPHD
jgi:hypothetical protein